MSHASQDEQSGGPAKARSDAVLGLVATCLTHNHSNPKDRELWRSKWPPLAARRRARDRDGMGVPVHHIRVSPGFILADFGGPVYDGPTGPSYTAPLDVAAGGDTGHRTTPRTSIFGFWLGL